MREWLYEFSEGAFDRTVAAIGIVALTPLALLIALLIRIDSPGPILFWQTRVGRHGHKFKLLKFCSMKATGSDGIQVTASGDPRITRVGVFLRRTKLDELPQLWNVLKGEMSLVGPRPEVAEFTKYYPEDARTLIFSVRPGMTGLTQVRFKNESDKLKEAADVQDYYVNLILPEKIKSDCEYVRSRCWKLDLEILLKTFLMCCPSNSFCRK